MWRHLFILTFWISSVMSINSREQKDTDVSLALWNPKKGTVAGMMAIWEESGVSPCKRDCHVLIRPTDQHTIEAADAIVFGGPSSYLGEVLGEGHKLPKGRRNTQPWIYIDEPEQSVTLTYHRNMEWSKWKSKPFLPDWIASDQRGADVAYALSAWGTGDWPAAPAPNTELRHQAASAHKHGPVPRPYLGTFYLRRADDCRDRDRLTFVRRLARRMNLRVFGRCRVGTSGALEGATHTTDIRDRHLSLQSILYEQQRSTFCVIIEPNLVKARAYNAEGREREPNRVFSRELGLALLSGCVPVYNGDTQQARRWLPEGSFVDASQFRNADALADHLQWLKNHQWELSQYHAWRSNGTALGKYDHFLRSDLFHLSCKICNAVRKMWREQPFGLPEPQPKGPRPLTPAERAQQRAPKRKPINDLPTLTPSPDQWPE